jgi:hypothetical protein
MLEFSYTSLGEKNRNLLYALPLSISIAFFFSEEFVKKLMDRGGVKNCWNMNELSHEQCC